MAHSSNKFSSTASAGAASTNKGFGSHMEEEPCSERCRSVVHGRSIWKISQGGNDQSEVVCLWAKTCSNYSQVKDEFGRTALHAAATTGNLKAVEWLIKTQQCNINAKDLISGYTALHRSIYFGHLQVARSLIKLGADVNIRDNEGLTAFELCQMDRPLTFKQYAGDMTELTVWGSNANYNLGYGHQEPRLHPDVAPEFRKTEMSLSKVEMNTYHTLFLTQMGKVYACGYGMGGRLGTGDEVTVLSPLLVHLRNNGKCRDIAVGQDHSIFLTESKVWTVGSNEFGQLGHSSLPSAKLCNPRTVDSLEKHGIGGILAGPFHSIFYGDKTVFVCGQNLGQFGRGFEEVTNILVPTKLKLSLDNNVSGNGIITTVGGNEFCTAICVERRHVFLLRRHQYTRIDSRNTTNQEILKMQASGEKNSITLFLLTASGRVLVWRENFNRATNEYRGAFTRLVFSNSRLLDVKDFSISLSSLVVVTNTGEAYKAGWNCNNPPSIVGKMEERYGQVAAADFKVAVRQRRGKREDEAPSMALELMKVKRVPNVHTGLYVSSDPKGNNFAVLQRHQMMDVTDIPYVTSSCMDGDIIELYQETSMEDSIHDVVFDMGGFDSFPAHRFIVATASPVIAKILLNNLTSSMIKVSNGLFGVDPSKCTSLENPKVFKALLDLIYTRECEYTTQEHMEEILDICKSDGKPNTSLYLEKCKEMGRFRNLCRHLGMEAAEAVVQRFMNALDTKWELCAFHGHKTKICGNYAQSAIPDTAFKWDNNDPFADVVLESSDKVHLRVHKCILGARLNYFKSMFSMNWNFGEPSHSKAKGSQTPKMILPFTSKALRLLLDCVYTNNASALKDADCELLCETIACSDYMMNDRLLQLAESEMIRNITLKNAADILAFTWKHNGSQLKNTCFDFISLNLTAMLENRLLDNLSVEILLELSTYYRSAQRNYLLFSRQLEKCPGIPDPQDYQDATKHTSEDILEQLELIEEADGAMVMKKTQAKAPRSRVRLRSRTFSESEAPVENPEGGSSATGTSGAIHNENLRLSCSSSLDETPAIFPQSPPYFKDKTPPVTPVAPEKERKLVVPLPKNIIGPSPPKIIQRSTLKSEEFPSLGASVAGASSSPPSQVYQMRPLVKTPSSAQKGKSPQPVKLEKSAARTVSGASSSSTPSQQPPIQTPSSSSGKKKTKWRAVTSPADVVNATKPKGGAGDAPAQQLTADGRDRNNPWKVNTSTKQVVFKAIVEDEVEKKRNFEKVTSKSLPMMQIEDEAINILTRRYTSDDTQEWIEMLNVERVINANFSTPTWVQHSGAITSPPPTTNH